MFSNVRKREIDLGLNGFMVWWDGLFMFGSVLLFLRLGLDFCILRYFLKSKNYIVIFYLYLI